MNAIPSHVVVRELGEAMDMGKPWDGPMVPAPRLRQGPTCASKRRYACKKDAILSAVGAMSRTRNRPKMLRAYLCPKCQGWHLTHTAKRPPE